MTAPVLDPNEDTAIEVVWHVLKVVPSLVTRFNTGAQHFVYDVTLPNGRKIVVRLSRRANLGAAKGAIYWSERLRPLGVPLPEVICADLSCDVISYPYLVLERLPGRDLGDVYECLSISQRRTLASRLIEVQRRVLELPHGDGFGFVTSPKEPFPYESWQDAVASEIDRSRQRIRDAGIVAPSFIDHTFEAWSQFEGYMNSIQPVPFLHDITTKNVIMNKGELSGIVDVDDLCFGDPMYLPALVNIALRSHGRDSSYVDELLDAAGASTQERKAVDFYSLVHCLGFLGELGTRFNRDAAAPVDPIYQNGLENLFEELCATI